NADPGGWLYRTAVRIALDELRKQARHEKYARLFRLARTLPSPEQLYLEKQTAERVRIVLASIKRQQAELLIFRSESLSYQEIAEVLQLNQTSIGTLLSRAQEAFRKEYTRLYGE